MRFGILLLVVAQSLTAQQPANDATNAVRRNWTDVSGWITKAADLVPADRYTYKPTAAVRTFGQLIGHVIDNVAHTSLHYGNVITYLRMMGLVPPSS